MLNYFADVNAHNYFYNGALWTVEKGITGGAGKLPFNPNALPSPAPRP